MRRLRRPRRDACPGVRMMRRRDVISLLGGAAVAWPMVARAQQQPNRVRNVAWLGVGQAGQPSPYLESLRAGLRELGWVEGRDLKLSTFWACDAGVHGDRHAAGEGREAGRVRLQRRSGRCKTCGELGAAGRQFHRHELSRHRAGRQARRAAQGMAARHEAHRGAGTPATSRRGSRAPRDRGGREEARDGVVVFSLRDEDRHAAGAGRRSAATRTDRPRNHFPRDRRRPLRRGGRFSGIP